MVCLTKYFILKINNYARLTKGSLLWKVDGFEYDKITYGFVEDYERQFWLLSDDHRGTSQKYLINYLFIKLINNSNYFNKTRMGRVLTLVKKSDTNVKVYGIAYRLKTDNIEKTFDHLNFREKCGYSLKEVDFYPHDNQVNPVRCACYFANEENAYYSPLNDNKLLSKQIHETIGPSGIFIRLFYNIWINTLKTVRIIGTNKEYLYNVCNSLRILAQLVKDEEILKHDKHLFALEDLVKELDTSD